MSTTTMHKRRHIQQVRYITPSGRRCRRVRGFGRNNFGRGFGGSDGIYHEDHGGRGRGGTLYGRTNMNQPDSKTIAPKTGK